MTLLDSKKNKKFKIRGPSYFSEVTNDFEVYTADYGTRVGKITNTLRNNKSNYEENESSSIIDYELNCKI